MKFIIKLFPEITIKSQSVRLRFIKILTGNIRNTLRSLNEDIKVVRHWDHIEVRAKNEALRETIVDELTRIPGIHHVLAVEDRAYTDMHDIFEQTLALNRERLENKSFSVRVKHPQLQFTGCGTLCRRRPESAYRQRASAAEAAG